MPINRPLRFRISLPLRNPKIAPAVTGHVRLLADEIAAAAPRQSRADTWPGRAPHRRRRPRPARARGRPSPAHPLRRPAPPSPSSRAASPPRAAARRRRLRLPQASLEPAAMPYGSTVSSAAKSLSPRARFRCLALIPLSTELRPPPWVTSTTLPNPPLLVRATPTRSWSSVEAACAVCSVTLA